MMSTNSLRVLRAGPVPEGERGGPGPDQRRQGDRHHSARRRLLLERRVLRHHPRVLHSIVAMRSHSIKAGNYGLYTVYKFIL